MFFVVAVSLAALAAAEPEIQQPIQLEQPVAHGQPMHHGMQQRVVEDPNPIPFYKQSPNPIPLSGYRKMRFFPYFEDMKEKYPTRWEKHPTWMGSGLREQRVFPYYEEMKESYPFLPYNYKNIMEYPYKSDYSLRYMNKPETSELQPKFDYDSQDYFHHHDVNHHHIFNNVHDFKEKHVIRKDDQDIESPYFPYYDKLNMLNRGYPHGSMHYSRGLEQEYVQPWDKNDYGSRYWDIYYIRNYYGNLNSEITRPYMYRNWDKPLLYRKMDYVQPVTSKSPDVAHIQLVTSKSLDVGYIQPVISKSLDLEYVQPVSSRSAKELNAENLNNIHFNPSKSGDSNVKPIRSENLGMDETHTELKQDTPVTDLRNAAPNVELSHQTPAVTEQHEVVAHEQITQEVRRQDVQLNANLNADATSQAEDHISQEPIHRQTRDTTAQPTVDVPQPQYTFYPSYYLYTYYLPIQPAPLLTRSVLYPYLPYYYNLLLRK